MECVVEEMSNSNCLNINNLNDDCLLQIFQFLPVLDNLKTEKVCRRWKHLSPLIWSQYRFRTLNMSESSWFVQLLSFPKIEESTAEKIILKLARHITTIDLSNTVPADRTKDFKTRLMCDIFKECHKLDTLYLTKSFEERGLDRSELRGWMNHYANQLTKFGYACYSFIFTDKDIFDILSRMKNMKHLFIDSMIGDTFLTHLPKDSLEELIMENCGDISLEDISKSLWNFTKLHTLCGSGIGMSDRLILPKNAPIKNLGLTMTYMTDNPNWADSILLLTNIEKLNLELNDNVDDRFMISLGIHCRKITFLNINGCSRVTDKGTVNIKNFTNLRHLGIASSYRITGKNLGILPNLEVLDASRCELLNDDALIGIVRHSQRLRILNVSECGNITNALMRVAVNATRKRENGLTLHVSIKFTEVKLEKLKKRSPLLIFEPLMCYMAECNTGYNGYFPTYRDFYSMDGKIRDKYSRREIYTKIEID